MAFSNKVTRFVEAKFTTGSPAESQVLISNVAFIPDEIKIKNLLYFSDGKEAGLGTVRFDLVRSDIGVVADIFSTVAMSEVSFKNTVKIDGGYLLQIRDYLTGDLETDRNGKLSFFIEFIKN
jgi:hypothetical protein